MKIIFLILIVFISSPDNSFSQPQYFKLKEAYNDNSKLQLWNFFLQWHKEIPTITEEEFNQLNDTLKNAYLAFKEFYQPQDLKKIGNPEFGFHTYDSVRFFLVQNYIRIYFADKVYFNDAEVDSAIIAYIYEIEDNDSVRAMLLKRENGKFSQRVIDMWGPYSMLFDLKEKLTDSITNFRPQVVSKNFAIPVYLNEKYEMILNKFLGSDHVSLGENNIMMPAYSVEESAERKKFLENFVKIFYGHWGGYWQLDTYPVGSIIFDKNMEYAKIDFRMIYQGGHAFLRNNNGKWELIFSELTWIE
ncbi:MAG TPA: hypothetical protein VHP32_09745 [Ignavibacteria bacterium]|nr:hypothetical protein [Ignavibacteria bacterium]